MDEILSIFAEHAEDSLAYARAWKARTGGRVIGSFPMHFPVELAHAADALPVIIQERDEPITVGQGSVFSFYCGYNRSIVDQAVSGQFDFLDAIMFGDHCVQLLGSADVIRWEVPGVRILFNQLISSMNADWAGQEARNAFIQLRTELEEMVDHPIDDEAIRASIRLFNRDRTLIRELYDVRRAGKASLSARQLQHVVKSSMVMDKAEHIALMEQLLGEIAVANPRAPIGVPVYLSGHLCQPPRLELLDLIENCGAMVVDDDLYHGYRFIASDIEESGDPIAALAQWYLTRNRKVPCPTRVDATVDWEAFLLRSVKAAGAKGLIVLMAKFCEPHMYQYPEIKEAFEARGIPHLLIETEHEGMPLEAFRTRIETFLEIAKRPLVAA